MLDWLSSITAFFVNLVKDGFLALVDFVKDAVVFVLDAVLGALSAAIAAIPAPAFLSQGLDAGGLIAGLPAFALYVAGQTRIGEAMAIISAGVAFYLVRKIVTLGQW